MPYKMEKVDGYQVRGPSGVHAKNTSKRKAKAQIRLMKGVEHGMVPRSRKAGGRRGARA